MLAVFSPSLLAPFAYAAFLFGSLLIFSRVYRKRQINRAQREPWFGVHHTRDIYVSLLSMDPPPPRKVLVAALIRRAMTDIQRVMEIRENKAALTNLLSKGQIGDDTWNHILETEKEMDAELQEVAQEANTFKPGWGQYIFPHAGDMLQHEKNKKQFENIEKEREKLAQLYSNNAPLIQPSPVLGLVGGKRSLPSTTPSNAQVPGSRSGTPQPPGGAVGGPGGPGGPAPTPAQVQAALQQRARLQQAQQQHSQNMQRNNGTNTLSPQATPPRVSSQQQSASGKASPNGAQSNATANGSGSGSATKAINKSNGSTTPSSSTTTTKTPPNGSSPATATASPMQRQASTATLESDADDDGDEDDAASNAGTEASQPGSSKPSPGSKKTPKKKNKKKGKKK